MGTGPLPITSMIICIAFHVCTAVLNQVAMESKSSPENSTFPLSLLAIACLRVAGIVGDGSWIKAMKGEGMFGVGGAIGPGKAAKAGYQGSPGTRTDF